MTNKEIKIIIENDIKEIGTVEAFKKVIIDTIKANVPQFKKMPKSFEKILYLANVSVSLAIKNFKDVGLMSNLYNVVLCENYENIVQDEIMSFAINETLKLLTE